MTDEQVQGMEQELSIPARDVRVGDCVYVGHLYWAPVTTIEQLANLFVVACSGLAHPLVIAEDVPVQVRRS